MKPPIRPTLLALSAALFGAIGFLPAETLANRVDFGFSPPEWQTSICLPDDPQKTLVDRSGELLYHYGRGGREFATHIGIEVSASATWTGQNLASARVPVVRTTYSLGELEIIQESFAVTRLVTPKPQPCPLKRIDQGGVNQNWAKPPAGVAEALANIAVNMGGSIHYELMVPPGAARKIALALCESWWNEPGKRIEILQVEGAASKTIDTVADIGRNKAAAFWFDARDTNGDGKILINVDPTANCLAKMCGKRHRWLKTDTKQAGMGPADNGPLPSSPCCGTKTAIVDESKETGATCYDIPKADEDCVNDELAIGKPLGDWGANNNCNTFAGQVIKKCGGQNVCPKWTTVCGPDFGYMDICTQWAYGYGP